MATQINPVQRTQRVESRGGRLGGALGKIGGVVGGVGGGVGGFVSGGPLGAAKGAIEGAAVGATSGKVLGDLIDPTKQQTIEGMVPQGTNNSPSLNLTQKYRTSSAGKLALQGLEAIRNRPDLAEYQKPLALAVMQDIAMQNPRGQS